MTTRRDLTTAEHAWSLLEPHLTPLPIETVTRRNAWRQVLATGIEARLDVPAQDVSAMDGYAVGAGELPQSLPVDGTIAAGDAPEQNLTPGHAARIMTGAPLPAGADRIIPIELTDGGTSTVQFEGDTASGAHIRRRAEVVAAGAPLLSPGTAITPGAIAALATHGIATLEVHRAPTVAIITTGDEVVPPDVSPRPGQLRDSHTDFLLAAGRGLALDFDSLGIAADDPDALAERVSSGMRSDVLIIGGGVSKGAYDWVASTLTNCGCELLFHGVAIQPGKPLLVAHHAEGIVFGLPGNPNSLMATFSLFVRPAIRRLLGHDDRFWGSAIEGELAAAVPGSRDRDRFLPARVTYRDNRAMLDPISAQGSHDMNAFAVAQALIRIPAGSEPKAAGDACSWQLLET